MRGDPNYNAVPPGGYSDEAPCETGAGCQFEPRCDRSPLSCGDYQDSLADQVVDWAIDEARLRRKERQ